MIHKALRSFRHLIHTKQLTREWLEDELFPLCDQIRKRNDYGHILRGCSLYCLFYEPSLLTRTSFERAMQLLGGQAHHTEDASQFFPVRDPTYIENTVRLLASLHIDTIVLRSSQPDVVERAAATQAVSIINGGSAEDHPSQALLDIYTLRRELGRVDGLRVGVVGRLDQRNVCSLMIGLAMFKDIDLHLIPISGQANQRVVDYCQSKGMRLTLESDIGVIKNLDAIYVNGPQTEAHAALVRSRGRFMRIDEECLEQLAPHCIILDPMQRTADYIVETQDPRLACYRQAENGLFIRMGLLLCMLSPGKSPVI